MKILVMGVGYVGLALIKTFQTDELFLTTTSPNRMEELQSFSKQVLLLPNETRFQEWVNLCDAAIIMVAPNHDQTYEETYLKTAQRVAAAIKGRKTPLHLIYTSSTSVCDGIQEPWITEEMDMNPQTEKGAILLAAEQILLHCGARTCILRLGGIYGPNRDFVQRARALSGKEIGGTGEEPTNHIHLDDIVRAIHFCLNHRLEGVYHLVNDDHRSRKEIYGSICAQLGLAPPIWNPHLPTARKGGYRVSNQKIKEAGFVFSDLPDKTI